MKIAVGFLVLSTCALVAGCAAPITYYSASPKASKPSMVQFTSQSGTYSTIVLYQEPKTCKGIQRVAFFDPGVNKTVYVPNGKYLTFSAYVQFPGYPKFKYGSSMYSVPFESGDLRVRISYNAEAMFTLIERRRVGGDWTLVKDAVERKPHQPFLESGDWCESTPSIQ